MWGRVSNFTPFLQSHEISRLNLSRNRLTSIPDSMGDLKRLKVLDLSHNQLEVFPEMLGRGQLLSHLNLSHNMIDGEHYTLINYVF